MTLTAADVAEIMRLVEQSGFDELNLEIDGTKISLRRGAGSEPATQSKPAAPAAVAIGAAPDVTGARVLRTPSDPNSEALPAPLLGTFYRAPKPGAPPFVEVGAPVSEDTIVGIIEVMKLMNTVRAGMRGTITEILAVDGALVEFGETLMCVRKTG
jgi:acetyl-CoA carboxylase biotin carboxyl carrier protein